MIVVVVVVVVVVALWGVSGGSWAAVWNPLGHFGLSLGPLGASRGCLEGLDGTFFEKDAYLTYLLTTI